MHNSVISMTSDGALNNHLDLAAPLLEERGFRGTFFINFNSQSFIARFSERQVIIWFVIVRILSISLIA